MKNFVRIVVTLLLLAGLGAGGYWAYNTYMGQASATTAAAGSLTQVIQVQQGDLNATVSVVGEMYAPENETLSFDRLAGTTDLLTLAVEPGNTVQAGDLLAAVDPAPYQQALDQAASDLQAAQDSLTQLVTPVTDLQLAQADLAVAKADLAVQQAQEDLTTLLNPDVAALQTRLADAQLSYSQAQSSLVTVQADQASKTTADKLSRLRDTESTAADTYSRLASETYSDSFYQDRLRLAYNTMMDAQDGRVTAELQQQVSLLQAQSKLRQANVSLADAQTALADATAEVDPLVLAQTKQQVDQALANLAQAQADRVDLDAGPDAVALAAAKADVDKKQLAVISAQADLDGATLVAPFAGTVLQVNAAVGARITANSQIMTLANLDQLEVLAAIDETTIRQISAGQPAKITFDAFPGQTFTGQVLSVPLQGALQGGVMVYSVPISLEGAENLSLLVGMTANISVVTGQAQNALLIPTLALQTVNGLNQVMVPGGTDPTAAPVSVPVEIGVSDGTYTQIVRGLVAGDSVVVQYTASTSTTDLRAAQQLLSGGTGSGRRPPGE